MKIRNQQGAWTEYQGLSNGTLDELSRLAAGCLKKQPFVLICITGNKGIGKSLLGKSFRRHGIGCFRPRQIAVIDDDNMAVDFLFFFRRWNAIPCRGIDELEPFYSYCSRKPIRVYIKSNPESRISKADIVLQLSVDEETRKRRLMKRYGAQKGNAVAQATQQYDPMPKITFEHLLKAVL